ncbi:Lysine-specific demethylase 5D [Fasciola hepatica]|uniref:[histone H3]-trimethyl-L-lysine(4) demethylase n=1 Tax=Fasciola hepatica TaxID=6192 RepID=A0A4E0RUD1_FASHE|nr:Lysine-specific demethylase 5D [Fasciola hepatica]
MDDGFTFVPPPEAPVFRPTEEEFRDPLEYLMKIRHIGTKTGICKIIPPKSWNPPFAVNMKEFSFTPRVQRLYELEAHSRIKLNFISRLYKFFRTQGGDKIRVPSIGGRFLDLYTLHKEVRSSGGYEKICIDHSWASVAEKLGYQSRHASSIKTNYEKLLLAFDNLLYSELSADKRSNERKTGSKRLRLLPCSDLEDIGTSTRRELRNLQFFGPGPKAAVPLLDTGRATASDRPDRHIDDYFCRICDRGDDEDNLLVCDTDACQACYHTYCLKPPLRSVPKCQWKCPECIRSVCLQPPEPYGFPQSSKSYSLHEFGVMADEFKSKYFGKPCTEVSCAAVEHEFWRILQEYNDDVVVEYGADIHSSSKGSGFPTEARLPNLVGTAQQLEDAKMYAISPWNLNILPLLDRSVLRFIKGNIDGMKIPWCYVGMVFSSFCWHIEDHWSYSINFNHWGEPKTWYGVSRFHAEDFERAMRKHAPELFDQSPDLLHHITTNMNPNILQGEGVPIYRTDQHCGEFVVTFPRAYHAGFNQGFNFAEAVNICLPDWLPIGRECVEHYSEIKRHCVFSNDELLCTLAEVAIGRCRPEDILLVTNPYTPSKQRTSVARRGAQDLKSRLPPGCSTAGLDISAIAAVHQEFTILLTNERRLRDSVQAAGVKQMEKVRFDELPDDIRVCDVCLTTLFLSGVRCSCAAESPTQTKAQSTGVKRRTTDTAENSDHDSSFNDEDRPKSHMVCLKHVDQLCSSCAIASFTLKYHYTLEELEELETALAYRLKHFYAWRDRLASLLKSAETVDVKSKIERDPVTSSSSIIVKKESSDNMSDQASISEIWDTTITLNDLLEMLREGREAGYHTDDIFSEAESLVKRGNQLLVTCSSVIPWISAESETFDLDKTTNQLIRFQLRLPATFNVVTGSPTTASVVEGVKSTPSVSFVTLQHEMDLHNPRELDLTRLLESCKQLHPINLLQEPCVQSVKHFLDRLAEWRQVSWQTATGVCRLILTTSTRSLAMASAGGKRIEIDPVGDKMDKEEQAFVVISRTVDEFYSEFPRFASRIPEWNTLSLVRQALKWLCIFKRRQYNEHLIHSWTVPRLRHHVTCGETLLAQLTQISNSSTTKVLSKTTTTQSPHGQSPRVSNAVGCAAIVHSPVDSAIAPVTRLLRARMHTALGQLSQLVVQIDSLVGILTESLMAAGPISFAELSGVLDQLRSLKIEHLFQWSVPESIKAQAEPLATEDNSDKVSVLSDFEEEQQSVNDLSTSPVVSDSVQHLRELLSHHVESLLTASESHVPLQERPLLTDAETLLELGRLLSTPQTQADTAETDSFDQNVIKLEQLICETHQACDSILQAFGGQGGSETATVLQNLLPNSLSTAESEQTIRDYTEAYSKGPSVAMASYEDILCCRRASVIGLIEATLNENALCPKCSTRFGSEHGQTGNITRDCPFCPLLNRPRIVVPEGTSRSLLDLWSPNKPATYGLLCTPEVIALHLQYSAMAKWMDELVLLLRPNSQLIDRKCMPLDSVQLSALPRPVRSVLECTAGAPSAASDSALTTMDDDNDDTVRDIVRQLQTTMAVGLLFNGEHDTVLSLITQLVSSLLSPPI